MQNNSVKERIKALEEKQKADKLASQNMAKSLHNTPSPKLEHTQLLNSAQLPLRVEQDIEISKPLQVMQNNQLQNEYQINQILECPEELEQSKDQLSNMTSMISKPSQSQYGLQSEFTVMKSRIVESDSEPEESQIQQPVLNSVMKSQMVESDEEPSVNVPQQPKFVESDDEQSVEPQQQNHIDSQQGQEISSQQPTQQEPIIDLPIKEQPLQKKGSLLDTFFRPKLQPTQNNNLQNDIAIKPAIRIVQDSDEEQEDTTETQPQIKHVESSGEEDEVQDVQEIHSQTNEDIRSLEVDKDNHIMMSMVSSTMNRSLQKKEQDKLMHQSFRVNQNDLRFSSKAVFMKGSMRPEMVRKDEFFHINLKDVLRIQKYFRTVYRWKVFLRKMKMMVKRNKYRKNVIKEIIETEENYVRDLNIIITYMLKPLQQFIPNGDLKIMFNVDSIYGVNLGMLEQLRIQKQTLDSNPHAKVMEKVFEYTPYFKLYYDYCNNYNNAQKLIEKYEKTNKQFQDHMNDLKKQNILRGLDVYSFVVKPVQRLPKYVLLFKDLLKHTDKDHPDYNNIEQCLKKFEQINNQNNEGMCKYLGQLKILELQAQFGANLEIAEPNREFIFEEACQIYTQNSKSDQPVILYAFNNLLLLQKNEDRNQRYLSHVELTSASFINLKEDLQFYNNILEIFGRNGSIAFVFQTDEAKDNLRSKLQSILDELKARLELNPNKSAQEQSIEQVKVQVTGTEIRNISQLSKYTVYIIQITIGRVPIKIFIRYSQIQEVANCVKKYDPKLKIPQFNAKVIDERKLIIEQFLQLLLNSSELRVPGKYQETILKELNLDLNFYKLPQAAKLKHAQTMDSNEIKQFVMESQFGQTLQPQSLTESQVHNIMMSKLKTKRASQLIEVQSEQDEQIQLCKLLGLDDVKIGQEAVKCEVSFQVNICDGRKLEIGLKRSTRVSQVTASLGLYLGLQAFQDFRLFVSDINENIRVIDEHEQLASLVENNQNVQKHGFGMKVLKGTLGKLLKSKEKFKLFYKKYTFLGVEQEVADYSIDPIRLRLITFQIYEEISKEKYIISFSDYSLVAALYVMIQVYSINPNANQIDKFEPSFVKSIIPHNIYKAYKDKIWLSKIIDFVKQLQSKVNEIQQVNHVAKNSKTKQFTSKINIAMMMFLNSIKQNPLFGMTIFFVECPKKTQEDCSKLLNAKINPNIYLGLNSIGLHFLNPSDKQIVYTSGFYRIEDMKAYALEFHMKIGDVSISFITAMSFEIKVMIQNYQRFHNFTSQVLKV